MSSKSLEFNIAFAKVYNDIENFPTISDVAFKLNIGVRTVYTQASQIKFLKKNDELQPELTVRKKIAASVKAVGEEVRSIVTYPVAPDEPIESLLERTIAHNQRVQDYTTDKDIVDIKIKIEGPFGIVGLPDNHMNNVGALVNRMFEDAKFIADNPAIFAVGIGDWIDNFIVGRLEQERRKDIMSHKDSWRLLEHYLQLIGPSLIQVLSGNHLDWASKMGGVDVFRRIMEDMGISAIYDTDESRVRLNCSNGTSFIHLARHKFPGNSKYNSMHGMLVWMLERWQGEDVFWGGHIHVAAHTSLEKFWMGKRRVIHGVQLPSYKEIDQYVKQEGFRRNTPFLTPMIVHNPENGKTQFFDDMYDGAVYLNVLREKYK